MVQMEAGKEMRKYSDYGPVSWRGMSNTQLVSHWPSLDPGLPCAFLVTSAGWCGKLTVLFLLLAGFELWGGAGGRG